MSKGDELDCKYVNEVIKVDGGLMVQELRNLKKNLQKW